MAALALQDNTPRSDRQTVTADELLELLGDEYVREILRHLSGNPTTATELAETTSCSKPTVYQRLKRLRRNGLVDYDIAICSDGHHTRRYFTVVEGIDIALGDGELRHKVFSDTRGRPP